MSKNKETVAQKQSRLAPSFEKFWDAYPRKQGKKPSFLKWCALNPDDSTYYRILSSIEAFKLTRQWQDPQYIPMPQTFLNQERWNDQIPEPAKKPGALAVGRGAESLVNERAVTIKIPEA